MEFDPFSYTIGQNILDRDVSVRLLSGSGRAQAKKTACNKKSKKISMPKRVFSTFLPYFAYFFGKRRLKLFLKNLARKPKDFSLGPARAWGKGFEPSDFQVWALPQHVPNSGVLKMSSNLIKALVPVVFLFVLLVHSEARK